MSLIQVASDLRSVNAHSEMNERTYRHLKSIDWKTSHTTRFQQATGDDKLVVGYDPHRECWVAACLRPRTIITHFGSSASAHTEVMPIVFSSLKDEAGKALSIYDPRIIPALKQADMFRADFSQVNEYLQAEQRERAEKKAALRDQQREKIKDLWVPWNQARAELRM